MRTKNIILTLVCLLMMSSVYAQQVTCRDIVRPMLHGDDALLAQYPDGKIDWYCAFSRNSFFVVDHVAEDAIVYSIADVKRISDGVALTEEFVVDLDSLSFYAYSFEEFRFRHKDKQVFFRTPSSSHAYLGLRPYIETLRRTNAETGQ